MAKRVLHDRYFKQAKREGYLARSAYKLAEIDDRKRVLRPGDRVLDLGCAPGSWLQVADQRVGTKGAVVGVDLEPVSPLVPSTVRTIVGDFTELSAADMLSVDGAAFDVVLSDIAPKTSGHGDHFRSVRLCESILDRTPGLLRPGGRLVMKVFEGEAMPDLLKYTKTLFADVSCSKPGASRDISRETYIIAKKYRGGRKEDRS